MDKRTCSAHIFWSSALSVTQRGQKAEEACHRRILRNITLLILQNHVRIKKNVKWAWKGVNRRTSPNRTTGRDKCAVKCQQNTLSSPKWFVYSLKGGQILSSTILWTKFCFLRLWCPWMFCEICWIWRDCWSRWIVCVTEPNNCNWCHSSLPCGAD